MLVFKVLYQGSVRIAHDVTTTHTVCVHAFCSVPTANQYPDDGPLWAT